MSDKDSGKKPSPFSVRFTRDERAQLEGLAGNLPLGTYLRSRLLGTAMPRRRRGTKSPIEDHKILAELLAKLGQSRLANNLNQLAKAANSGSLPVTPDIEAMLRASNGEILAMKTMLMTALGIREL